MRAAKRRVGGLAMVLALTGGAVACSSDDSSTASASHDQHAASETSGSVAAGGGQIRVHYVAADEVAWDYGPTGKNEITGEAYDEDDQTFVQQGPDRIGKVYEKSIYHEYTDDTFSTQVPVPAEWQHKGDLGPVLHAEVGDTLVVHFKNNTRFPAGMHPHGVKYAKDSEGSPYDDGTSGDDKADDDVQPGETHTYTWEVPERAGPGPADLSSVMWMYHGHTDEIGDVYAGLMGVIIVTKKGMANPDGSPKDVDRELVANFEVDNENASPWIDDNIAKYAGDPASVNKDDDDFIESNLMHSINGYVYGGLPGFDVKAGEKVRWYLMAMGTEVDLHTPHWHGNDATVMGMRVDVVQLLPAGMVVADMVPDDPGTWLFHCHVADHIEAGMLAKYTVSG